jgi:hypothetical protein
MKLFYIVLLAAACVFTACSKEEGEGGHASISGSVIAKKYDPFFNTLLNEYPASDVRVYIIYGDDITHSDDTRTAYDGKFEFRRLTKGKYKIYVYSVDSSGTEPSGIIPVIREAEIGKKKESIDIGTMSIIAE